MEQKSQQQWKVIQDYPDYAISDIGNVKRISYGIGNRSKYLGLIKSTLTTDGYLQILLYKNKTRKSFKVHSLVATAFLGHCPADHEINHKDGNKQNCMVENLEYVTKSENQKHAYRNGLRTPVHFSGEKNPMAKVSDKEVNKIRQLKKQRISGKEIARMFGISRSRVYCIWKDPIMEEGTGNGTQTQGNAVQQ